MTSSNSDVAGFLLNGKDPERTALRLVDREHSYGDLQHAASEVSSYLLQLAGQKGDRVLLVGDNSFFWVAAYLGILRAGLVCVPLPAAISAEDLDYILQITAAKFAFLQFGFAIRNGEHFQQLHLVTDREVPNLPGLASRKVFGDILSEA